MSEYKTGWTISPDDVEMYRVNLKQKMFFAFQVTGTQHLIVWLDLKIVPYTMIDHFERYAVFMSTTTTSDDGDKITQAVPPTEAKLGFKYTYEDGTFKETSDGIKDRIVIVNKGDANTFLGLSKWDAKAKTFRPICGDPLGKGQAARYTPKEIIYACVGSSYETSTIIADIGNFNTFDISGGAKYYKFNAENSDWIVDSSPAKELKDLVEPTSS